MQTSFDWKLLSMTTSSRSDFASLLKQSKVLQLSTRQPAALTSRGGYLSRGDFGLKRPLPVASIGKTPYIRLTSRRGVDGSDFESSAKQALFISRWDEAGLAADEVTKTSRYSKFLHYSPFDKSSHAIAFPLQSETSHSRTEPELHPSDSSATALSRKEEDRIFKAIMQQQDPDQALVFDPPLSQHGQTYVEALQQGKLHKLEKPSSRQARPADYIPPMPHPVSALNYLSPNRLQLDHLQRPLPARYLQDNSGSGKTRVTMPENNPSSVLGVTVRTADHQNAGIGVTQFLAPRDTNNQIIAQARNKAAGLGLARVVNIPTAQVVSQGFTDGSNDDQHEYYAFEKRLKELMKSKQMARQHTPQGQPAKIPEITLQYLPEETTRQFIGSGDAHRAPIIRHSFGSRSWVQGPDEATIEDIRANRAEQENEAELKETMDGLKPKFSRSWSHSYSKQGKGMTVTQRKKEAERASNKWPRKFNSKASW